MSNVIHEAPAGETYESLLAHGKANHMPIQAYEVAEFRERSVNYLEVIDAIAVVAAVAAAMFFAFKALL